MSAGSSPAIFVRPADLDDPGDGQFVIELLDMYSREPLGQAAPLADDVRARLLPGLRQHPGTTVLLAFEDATAVGIAVCFLGFSTFHARPLLNIHDLAVQPQARGRGVGRALLEAAQREAFQRNCCKITLEVRGNNHVARRLYSRFGFHPGDEDGSGYLFWSKPLECEGPNRPQSYTARRLP